MLGTLALSFFVYLFFLICISLSSCHPMQDALRALRPPVPIDLAIKPQTSVVIITGKQNLILVN